jgi:hypothetical protein
MEPEDIKERVAEIRNALVPIKVHLETSSEHLEYEHSLEDARHSMDRVVELLQDLFRAMK